MSYLLRLGYVAMRGSVRRQQWDKRYDKTYIDCHILFVLPQNATKLHSVDVGGVRERSGQTRASTVVSSLRAKVEKFVHVQHLHVDAFAENKKI